MSWLRFSPYVCRLPNPGKQLYPPPIDPVSPDAFRRFMENLPAPGATGQLYVHLPFCETICTFCPIFKQALPRDEKVAEYVAALHRELEHLSELPFVRALRFHSVYFGGGTPSVLPDRYLAQLVEVISKRFRLDSPQMTFEGHVSSLTREKMAFARSLGFNRLSTGVQTFDPAIRRGLRLTPTEADIRRCLASAREVGFDDFNLDLMYNLPGQSLAVWEDDLRKTIELVPTGVDVYEAVIAKTTPLYAHVKQGKVHVEARPEVQARGYLLAESMLGASGYIQKNLFAWDRPGYRNIILGDSNRLKTHDSHLVGSGLSAYSFLNGSSFMNDTGRRRYVERVRDTGLGVSTHYDTSGDQRLAKQQFMILSIQDLAFDPSRYRELFAADMQEDFGLQLASLRSRGLVDCTSEPYRLTAQGRAWAMTMSIEFYSGRILESLLRGRLDDRLFIPFTYEEEYQLPLFALFHPDVLLREWSRFDLIARYLHYLRRGNRQWIRSMLLKVMRSIAVRGFPFRPLYHLKLLVGLIVAPRPLAPDTSNEQAAKADDQDDSRLVPAGLLSARSATPSGRRPLAASKTTADS